MKEAVRYLGRQYRLRVIETLTDEHARIWAGWYEVRIPPGLANAARRREVRRRLAGSLRHHADSYLPSRLTEICRRLRVEQAGIAVREQAKRWGSCDRRGVLRINWRIIQAPIALLDYVLVHELAHLENRGHDRAFWQKVGRWLSPGTSPRSRRTSA